MSTKTATRINDLILANPQAFSIGNSMSAAQWRTLVSSIFKLPRSVRVQSNQFAYINSYSAFNRILRKRGLKVKSSGLYTSYKVVGKDEARVEATNMIDRAKAILNAANELQASIPRTNRNYSFRSLGRTDLATVGRYITKPLSFK